MNPSSKRVAIRFAVETSPYWGTRDNIGPYLTEQQANALQYWGSAGMGVGMKAPPEIVSALKSIRDTIKPGKFGTLYRGLHFPRGTIQHDGFEGPWGARLEWTENPQDRREKQAPPGWVRARESAYWYRNDPNFYRPYISGVRSWTPLKKDALYYANHGYGSTSQSGEDRLFLEWLSPTNIYVDTAQVHKLTGWRPVTDTKEVIADASKASIVGVRTEKGVVIVTVSG